MRKAVFITLSLIAAMTLSFEAKEENNMALEDWYFEKLEDLDQSLIPLTTKSTDPMEPYKKARTCFKQIEHLIAQLNPQMFIQKINGAPLPKLEKNSSSIRVLSPHGFQVLDEMVVESGHESEIVQEAMALRKHIKSLLKSREYTTLTKDLLAESILNQWIRVYTLSVTGFDTPGSLLAIEDVKATSIGIQKTLELSGWEIPDHLGGKFEKHDAYVMEHREFETFDRYAYYKEYWQPIYEELTGSIAALGVNLNKRASGLPYPVNFASGDLFSKEFFNVQAYLDFSTDYIGPESIALGKRLFSDKSLSQNKNMSCATCHEKSKQFTDGLTKVQGGDETLPARNTPSLINAVLAERFFYDLRSEHLGMQFEHVIFNKDEFNTTLLDILEGLKSQSAYQEDFKKAFPQMNGAINPFTFKTALGAYLTSLVSFETPFDSAMRGAGALTPIEVKGFNLFMGKAACATCHFAPTFSGLVPPYYMESESEVLGVPSDTTYSEVDSDPGRSTTIMPKERVDFYKHSFKTTSARNTEKTAPYMHNGVFEDLDQLLDFYNEGGGQGKGLAVPHQTLSADALDLNAHELHALKAFLKSLNEGL